MLKSDSKLVELHQNITACTPKQMLLIYILKPGFSIFTDLKNVNCTIYVESFIATVH